MLLHPRWGGELSKQLYSLRMAPAAPGQPSFSIQFFDRACSKSTTNHKIIATHQPIGIHGLCEEWRNLFTFLSRHTSIFYCRLYPRVCCPYFMRTKRNARSSKGSVQVKILREAMTSLGTRMYFIYVGYNGYKQAHSKPLLSMLFRNVGIFLY